MANKDYLYVNLEFYSDPDLENLVTTISSLDEYQNFFANGIQFTENGILLSIGECACITYNMTPEEHPELLGKPFYVKITNKIRIISESGISYKKVINFFVVDDSGSMQTEQEWLKKLIPELDAKLLGEGVEETLYGLVKFGNSAGSGGPFGQVLTGPISASAFVEMLETVGRLFVTNGGSEDGYEAISLVFESFDFSDAMVANIILITDEDRDILDESLTYQTTKDLFPENAILNVVVNSSFYDSNGNSVIGISADRSTYAIDGTEGSGGIITFGENGSDTTEADYIDLAFDLGGTAWNLNVLRDGQTDTFTDVFSAFKTREIVSHFLCNDTITPDLVNFFCPAQDPKVYIDEVILNDSSNGLVNQSGEVLRTSLGDGLGITDISSHFRISFYADQERKSLVHSSFSLSDQRKWFCQNRGDCPIAALEATGLSIISGSSARIKYVPDILPLDILSQQRSIPIGLGDTETPLICGITYYVDLDIYPNTVNEFIRYKSFEFHVDCSDVEPNYWNANFDAKNWISSGQGKDDFRITNTVDHTMFSDVQSNDTGQFMIVWQDHRKTPVIDKKLTFIPSVYYGIWDTIEDIIWSSGQSHADTEIIPNVLRPKVLLDHAQTFYVSAHNAKDIFVYKCPVSTEDNSDIDTSGCLLLDDIFVDIDNTDRAANQYLKARVWETDSKGSFVIEKDKVVSIVDDCLIRLDVIGVPGVIAVRLRNEDNSEWSDWISIDSKIRPVNPEGKDVVLDGFKIDNTRFLVPWALSPGHGMKRVCLQCLTFFGVSNTFCVDILANIQELDYKIEFFYDTGLTDPVPMYKGYPVMTNKVSTVSSDNSTGGSSKRDIFIKVTFIDKDKLKTIKKLG